MILYSGKKSAVHEMHLAALEGYARACSLDIGPKITEFSGLLSLMFSRDRVVFSQATGVPSLLALPLARLSGKRVVHYMHEPTPLKRKLKENPWVKSILWHAVQCVEMHVANRVMVSRSELREQAVRVYRVSQDKITLAPLLMPEVTLPASASKARVTYLGRIDERRYFQTFLNISPELAARGFVPTVLTGDTAALNKYRADLPPETEVFAERNFSEDLKTRILSETRCLWNPKRGEIAQSGVTADAIRYGVAILLTDKDPAFETLMSAGVALDYHKEVPENFSGLEAIEPASVSAQAAALFSENHGMEAFLRSYLPEVK